MELKIDILASIEGIIDSLKKIENKFESVGQKFNKIGKKLSLSITAPIMAIGAVSAHEFAGVEKGLREINTLFGLTGAESEKNFGMLARAAEEASKELGILQSDVIPAMYNAISAGIPKENVLEFIKVAGQASIGGVTNLNTAVDGLTSIINAFGLEAKDAGSVADSMFAAVQGGKTTFEELSSAIFNVAPAAAAAKVSMQEVNAAIAALTAGGTPTAVATTQIRAALTGLQRPAKELDVIFQALGYQNAQMAIESKGLGFALNAVKNASNGNNGALQQLLGSTEAVAAANVLAGTGAKKFNEELERQSNSAGSAARAAEEVDKSLSRQMERTKVAASNLALTIGQNLAPAMASINTVIEKVINFFSNLSPTTQKVIIVIAGLAAAIGPLLLGLGSVISIIPILTAGLGAVKVALVAMTGPVGIAIAILTSLAVAIIANWDKVKAMLINTKNAFSDFAIKILESIKPLADFFKMGDLVDKGILNLKKSIEQSKNSLSEQSEELKNTSNSALKASKDVDALASSTDNLNSKTKSFDEYSKAWDKFNQEVFGKADQYAQSAFGGVIKRIKEIQGSVITLSVNLLTEFQEKQEIQNKLNETDFSIGFTPAVEMADVDTSKATQKLLAFKDSAIQLSQQANQALSQGATNGIAALAGAIGASLAGGSNAFAGFGQMLLGTLAGIMEELGKAAIGIGITMKAIKTSFKNPGTAIAAGIALVAVSKYINTKVAGMTGGGGGGGGKSQGLTPFANGGIVSGPTPALVGEYTGAKTNPEVIAPLNKLQNMMGGNVNFVISGDNLVGTLNRANKTRSRKF
jgi:TP901 family phage tail tape measure protein